MISLYRMRQLIRQTVKVQWRIEREEAKATKITTTITGMPHGSGNRSKIEDGAIKVAELKDAYDEVNAELTAMRQELSPLIDTLDNVNDRAVMRLRYIKGYSPEDIGEAIYRTDRSIYYYLSRAEEQIAKRYPDKVVK